MPQPISTPTAAGMTAPLVGMTEPTVAPMPTWTSGMTATCLKMNGIFAARDSWSRAIGSTGTPLVHILTGAPPSTAIYSKLCSAIGPSLVQADKGNRRGDKSRRDNLHALSAELRAKPGRIRTGALKSHVVPPAFAAPGLIGGKMVADND